MTCYWGIVFYFMPHRISEGTAFGKHYSFGLPKLGHTSLGSPSRTKRLCKTVNRLHVMYYRPQNIHFLQNLFNI